MGKTSFSHTGFVLRLFKSHIQPDTDSFCAISSAEMRFNMISYEPLWATMKQKEISQYALLKAGIDNKTLDNLKKNKNITLLTVEKLCRILNCTPNDIVEFK